MTFLLPVMQVGSLWDENYCQVRDNYDYGMSFNPSEIAILQKILAQFILPHAIGVDSEGHLL